MVNPVNCGMSALIRRTTMLPHEIPGFEAARPSSHAVTVNAAAHLDTVAASKYLLSEHGIRLSPKSLTNRRYLGTGPRWQFWGCRPYTTAALLDEWVDKMFSAAAVNRRQARIGRVTARSQGEETG
jgi:hypothetical protein